FSYARVLAEKKRHRLSAGATLQLLHGLEAAYLHLRELDFLFSNKDTLSFLNAEFSTAHTERTGSILNVARSAAGKLAHGNPVRVGVDIGLSYDWKPSQGDGTGGVLTRMRRSRRARPYILRA